MTETSRLWWMLEASFDGSRNWQQQRRYEGTLARRVEGFTEVLEDMDAATEDDVDDGSDFSKYPVRLFQFQPAWGEQLALRVLEIPHWVHNSQYAVTEATGPLPALQDLPHHSMMGSSPQILDYLLHHRTDTKSKLQPQHSDTILYVTLIRTQLVSAWCALQSSSQEWDQIYKARCTKASGGKTILSHWQTRAYRRQLRLTGDAATQKQETILKQVRDVYQVLDSRLASNTYLLSSSTLTIADFYLWDHLMKALTDVHLVVVLAEYTNLIRFVQSVWDTYFASPTEDWQEWNAEQNANNAFAHVPSLIQDNTASVSSFQNAFELMEHLSIQDKELQQSLRIARDSRFPEIPTKQESFVTWHRWRRGGPFHDQTKSSTTEENNRRDYQRNDEAWMSIVSLATVMAVLLFGMSRQTQG